MGFEKDIIGFYISGHPLDDYKDQIAQIPHTLSTDIPNCDDGAEILLIATIEKYESKATKSGNKMHILIQLR